MNKRMTSSLSLLMCGVLLSTSILPTVTVFAETPTPTEGKTDDTIQPSQEVPTEESVTSTVQHSQEVPTEESVTSTVQHSQEVPTEESVTSTVQHSPEDKTTLSEQPEDSSSTPQSQDREIITDIWGTSPVSLDKSTGVLTVSAGTLAEFQRTKAEIGTIAKSDIKKIVFLDNVKAPSDSRNLFDDYFDNLNDLVGDLDTSNVTNMGSMFDNSPATSLDISNWDTSNVTNMGSMFSNSQATSLDISNWDTSNVTDMYGMFWASQVTSLDLSNWDTSSVTDMSYMFVDSQVTSLNLSKWNTSNVTNMKCMFMDSQATSLDLSNWDTSSVTDMSYMFIDSRVNTFVLGDKSKFKKVVYLSQISTSTGVYTGKWERVDPVSPISEYDSSADFMANYDGTQPGTYVWQKVKIKAKDLTVYYQDTEGNEVIAPKTVAGNVGDKFEEAPVSIEGYTFKEVKDNVLTEGTLSEEEQSVTFIYTKNPVKAKDLTVYYQDTEGNEISVPKTVTGNVGHKFKEAPGSIEGYTFKEVKDNVLTEGTLSEEEQSVTFIYTKNPVKAKDLTVYYQDTEGNEISVPKTVTGNVGHKFKEAPGSIEGYTFKEVKDNSLTEGALSEEEQSITFIYTKNPKHPSKEKSGKVTAAGTTNSSGTDNESGTQELSKGMALSSATSSNKENNNDYKSLPKTGENISSIATYAGFTTLILALCIWLFRRKQYK
ncbi:BspA family leucine-rich repeat surface protein [Enterococcus faecalis]